MKHCSLGGGKQTIRHKFESQSSDLSIKGIQETNICFSGLLSAEHENTKTTLTTFLLPVGHNLQAQYSCETNVE